MDFISRSEARGQGLKYYFIGEECSRGHIAERLITSNVCVECLEERNQKFLDENTDRVGKKLEKKKAAKDAVEYAKEVIEYLKETADPDSPESVKLLEMELSILPKSRDVAKYLGEKFYYTGTACELKGHMCKRVTKSGLCIQCVREYAEWYRGVYREEIAAYAANRRARVKDVGGTFSGEDVIRLYEDQEGLCNGCLGCLEKLGYHIDHIMPISKGGSNWPENLQLLCPPCNLEKHAKLPEEWEKIAKKKRREKIKNG